MKLMQKSLKLLFTLSLKAITRRTHGKHRALKTMIPCMSNDTEVDKQPPSDATIDAGLLLIVLRTGFYSFCKSQTELTEFLL